MGIIAASLFLYLVSGFWIYTAIPATLLLIGGSALVFVGLRPPIEVHDEHLSAGKRRIDWLDVMRVEEPLLLAPLMLPLILSGKKKHLLIYAGEEQSGRKLLHQIRRLSKFAFINGVPYRQYWDDELESFRHRDAISRDFFTLLREDDEEEIKRLFLRLKSQGTLHPGRSEDAD
jgi:hypothetical protein